MISISSGPTHASWILPGFTAAAGYSFSAQVDDNINICLNNTGTNLVNKPFVATILFEP